MVTSPSSGQADAAVSQLQGDDRPIETLILPRTLSADIVEHLRGALPAEGCGLLAIEPPSDGNSVATRFYPGTNILASPTRFTMNPIEVMAALRDIEGSGWWLGAIIHSHPTSPAPPSRTDLREAYSPRALLMIVSFAAGKPELRAWRVHRQAGAIAPLEVPVRLIEEGKRHAPLPTGRTL